MTNRVLVIGGSGQGRQVIDILEEAGAAEIVGVLDRGLDRGTEVAGYPVLGSDDDLAACAEASGADAFVVAIGDNAARRSVLGRGIAACRHLEPMRAVHPAAVTARNALIGPGAIVMAGAVVSNDCAVGTGALLGTRSSLDHDCVLGDYASLAPGVTVGGSVRIGSGTALGVGADVIHGVAIGDDTVIGAGALVLTDVPGGVVAHGAPARVVRDRRPDEPYLTRD